MSSLWLLATCLLVQFLATAAEARQVRVATFNVLSGVGTVGATDYNAVRDIIRRTNPDVVSFQELRLSDYGNWTNMAAELGYPHFAFGELGPFAGGLYLGYYSRFPILSAFSVTSPPGAVELTRLPYRAVIEVPGAARPLVIWNMHHKASNASGDKFRRSVEAHRIVQDMNAYVSSNMSHNEYMVMGDFNDDDRDAQFPAQFNSLPSGLPDSFVLGSDITYPVPYATFPLHRYTNAGYGLDKLTVYQEDSSNPVTRPVSGRQLDYMLISPALRDSPLGAPAGEIYNSVQDDGIGGLPKFGSPLPPATSSNASDHLLVFADVQMADDMSLNPDTTFISMGDPGGPFDPSNRVYTLSNPNGAPLLWSVTSTGSWISLSTTGGVVLANSSNLITVGIHTNANVLPPGSYTTDLVFRDESAGRSAFRRVNLVVLSPPFLVVAPSADYNVFGPAGGPFSPSNLLYTLSNDGDRPLEWRAGATSAWINLSAVSGTLPGRSSTSVVASLNVMVTGFPEAVFATAIIFTNTTTSNGVARKVNLVVGQRDFFTEIFTSSDNDLSYQSLLFTPDGSANFYRACRSGAATFPSDPAGGTVLALTDDSFARVNLPPGTQVSLYGVAYTSLFVNSNGRITFTAGSGIFTESLSDHFALPGIAGLFDDLNPATGGQISWKAFSNLVCVTYNNVPEFFNSGQNSFQIEMFYDGRIRITHLNRTAPDGLVGLSAGGGTPAGFIESNLNGYDLCNAMTPPHLALAPDNMLEASGEEGGPFTPAFKSFRVVNTGGQSMNWDAIAPAWVSLSMPGGVMAGGSNAAVTLSLNNAAAALHGGLYVDWVSFNNAANPANTTNINLRLLVRDGIPDDWRLAHFGHIEPDAGDASRADDDPDGDRMTNLDEYRADTQPTNAQSLLRLTDTFMDSDAPMISWQGGILATQKLEFLDITAAHEGWQIIFTNLPPTPITNTIYVPATNTAGWYRIKAGR